MTVDLTTHHRDRIRRLEQRVNGLERYRDQLERAYATACQILGAQHGIDPAVFATIIHELAEAAPLTPLEVAA